MSVLALADRRELETRVCSLFPLPPYAVLRGPEVGLAMVRGRAGGTGHRFNLGEATLTRCSVRVEGGAIGHAWIRGRDRRHAELAAVLDALLQDDRRRPLIEERVIGPLEEGRRARRRAVAARAGETRVEFFTMVRGED
jgi:alpha-D-ribose 1-methylphosphonate 5-triphosphate synthase subunit PhnG